MESKELIATELKGPVLPGKKETGAAMGRAEPGRVATTSAHGKLETPAPSCGSTPVINKLLRRSQDFLLSFLLVLFLDAL